MHKFKVGDEVIVFRRPGRPEWDAYGYLGADKSYWPGGGIGAKESLLKNRTVTTIVSILIGYPAPFYTLYGGWTMAETCLRPAKSKPIIILEKENG